jgi:hypothetical protein
VVFFSLCGRPPLVPRVLKLLPSSSTALGQKVAAIKAANGNAKIDAMAAVINEMVAQRKQMMANLSSMQSQMMAHMGEHMA